MKRPMPVTILTDVVSHMAFGYQKKADSVNGPSPAGPIPLFSRLRCTLLHAVW